MLLNLIRRHRELLLYALIGALSSGTDFMIYTGLVVAGLNLFVANVIGVNVGILLSFALNSRYNFKVTDRLFHRFLIFYGVGMLGLGLSTLLLWLMVEQAAWNEFWAKIITIVVVALFQFVLNKLLTFRKRQEESEKSENHL